MVITLKPTEMPKRKFISNRKDGAIFRPDKVIAREKAIKNAKSSPKCSKMVYIAEDRIQVDSKGRTEAETISDYFEKRKITKLTK